MRHVLAATLLGLTLLFVACNEEEEPATSTATAVPQTTAAAKTTAAPAMTMPAGGSAGLGAAAGVSTACAEWARAASRIMPGGGMAAAPAPGAMPGAMPAFDKASLDQSLAGFNAAVAAAPAAIKADMQIMQTYFVDFTKAMESVNYDMMRLFSSPDGAKLIQLQSDPKTMQAMQNVATWTAANCGGVALTPTPAR